MPCLRCGSEPPPGAKFCAECGSPLQRACARCGASLPPAARFCPQCGEPTDTAPERAVAAPDAYTAYDWFTEGFDTKDLREARALLETLA